MTYGHIILRHKVVLAKVKNDVDGGIIINLV